MSPSWLRPDGRDLFRLAISRIRNSVSNDQLEQEAIRRGLGRTASTSSQLRKGALLHAQGSPRLPQRQPVKYQRAGAQARGVERRDHAVMEVLSVGAPVVEVPGRYGVSRKAVHTWVRRYRDDGPPGRADRSHRPHPHPWQLAPDAEARSCELRRAHPHCANHPDGNRLVEPDHPSCAWRPTRRALSSLVRHLPSCRWPPVVARDCNQNYNQAATPPE